MSRVSSDAMCSLSAREGLCFSNYRRLSKRLLGQGKEGLLNLYESAYNISWEAEALEGKMKGIDIVAITCIVAFSLLIYSGHDSMLVSLLATIVGWYFGRASKKKEEE